MATNMVAAPSTVFLLNSSALRTPIIMKMFLFVLEQYGDGDGDGLLTYSRKAIAKRRVPELPACWTARRRPRARRRRSR